MTTQPSEVTRVHTVVPSAVGTLRVVGTGAELTGVYMSDQRHLPDEASFGPRDDGAFCEVTAQLEAYFAGQRTDFDLPLRLEGTEFQRRVWAALLEVPYGMTWSYGELAARAGSPGAARAVGLAVGRNPIAIIVPCHRIMGANGQLTGYGGGLERKRLLLDLEQRREVGTFTA